MTFETNLRQDRHIRFIYLPDRFISVTVTARQTQGRHNRIISAQTVRNSLKAAGLRSRRSVVGAILTRRHRLAHFCGLKHVITGHVGDGSASF